MKNYLFLMTLFLAGCAGFIPTSRDITPFRLSPDMEVQGCTVWVYASVDGMTADGRLYHRIGRVFVFPAPEGWDMAYSPRFNAVSSALTGLSGMNFVGGGDVRLATVRLTPQGWQAFTLTPRDGAPPILTPTRIVGADPKSVAIKMAVFLQARADLSACPSVQLK